MLALIGNQASPLRFDTENHIKLLQAKCAIRALYFVLESLNDVVLIELQLNGDFSLGLLRQQKSKSLLECHSLL
jgi:hypothetical protein